MPFPADQRERLLALKGVGATVVARLEQLGFDSLASLHDTDADELCARAAALVRSSCWKNSPQARAAMQSIVQLAAETAS
jgi:hypothetical protein